MRLRVFAQYHGPVFPDHEVIQRTSISDTGPGGALKPSPGRVGPLPRVPGENVIDHLKVVRQRQVQLGGRLWLKVGIRKKHVQYYG